MINKQDIETAIQCKVNALSSSSCTEDILATALSSSAIKTDYTNKVNTVNDLPDIDDTGVRDGMVVFVESLNVPVVSVNNKWVGLDGRLLRKDGCQGLLWSWGYNGAGRLGDGTNISRISPVSVVGGFTDWCQVSAGYFNHTAAVRTNGSLWAWGCGSLGRLGDGTETNRSSPVSVIGGFTDWCQVSAGGSHTAAVRTTGTLWAWGSNIFGQLGDSTAIVKLSPVSVVGGFTDWCQVSTGRYSTMAIRTNSTLWAWGRNLHGRLGDGTTTDRSSPVSVVGGFTDWCQVSAGLYHTAAVRTNGTLWAWGYNGFGRLGDGTETNRSSPVSVIGGFTNWCQVSAGSSHTAAVRTNGTLWSWGFGGAGELGINLVTIASQPSPVSVVGGFTDWCQVSAGNQITAAVRTNGSIWAWGSNTSGKLGDGTPTNRSSPVSVVGGFTDWCQVSAGGNHTAAVRRC